MTRKPSPPAAPSQAAGTVDVSILLDELQALEAEIARLYEWFSTLFADHPAAGDFFTKMSREEQKHADLVKFQRQLVLKDRAAFPPVNVDVQLIRKVVEKIRDYREQAVAPTLATAVRFAHALENSAVETHYRTALSNSNPTLAKFVNSLASADEHHAEALDRFAAEQGLTD